MFQIDLFREIIVDNFAGGGGASTGIEMATGLNVDIAINHDPAAIAMHKANHPDTEHYCESVWDVDPAEVVRGRKVGLCWLSPDCKHFSKAKGGKPVNNTIRGLAWIAHRWAAKVRPRVIILENVGEFQTWGPLKDGRPDPNRKGYTFQSFVKQFKDKGYEVDFRMLKACDYGAPTTRERLFMIARCDGKSIIWPEATHGEPGELNVQAGLKKPYRSAGEIIDWSLPTPSIFARKKPLQDNTLLRISRGIKKFILDTEKPYVVDNKAFFLQHYYTHQGKETRASSLNEPLATIPTANRFGLVSAFLTKYYGQGVGQRLDESVHTIPTKDRFGLVSAFLTKYYGTNIGLSLNDPLHTVTAGGNKFGLVTVNHEKYVITDIGMRMLQPHELFAAQGFPSGYIIDKDHKAESILKAIKSLDVVTQYLHPLQTH
ncbi:C-5 cytosine-specific DNA methylase family protein [Bacillus sp. JCM 19046]|nr:C-5 cytosine-specific DNA methylase family protein [Bacillus sp. JCM 19046]